MSANRWSDSRKRRHKLLIRRVEEIDDGKGAYIPSWTTIAEPWAEAEGLNGREAMLDQSLQSIAVFRFRTRYTDKIKTADQVRFGELNLNITSAVDPIGTRRDLIIIATTEGARSDGP